MVGMNAAALMRGPPSSAHRTIRLTRIAGRTQPATGGAACYSARRAPRGGSGLEHEFRASTATGWPPLSGAGRRWNSGRCIAARTYVRPVSPKSPALTFNVKREGRKPISLTTFRPLNRISAPIPSERGHTRDQALIKATDALLGAFQQRPNAPARARHAAPDYAGRLNVTLTRVGDEVTARHADRSGETIQSSATTTLGTAPAAGISSSTFSSDARSHRRCTIWRGLRRQSGEADSHSVRSRRSDLHERSRPRRPAPDDDVLEGSAPRALRLDVRSH